MKEGASRRRCLVKHTFTLDDPVTSLNPKSTGFE